MLQRNKYLSAQGLGGATALLTGPPRGHKVAPRIAGSRQRRGPYRGGENRGECMGVETIIIWLIVGAIAGWLAGMVVKGGGFGLIGDIIVGIIGAVIAGWLLPRLGIYIGGGIIAAIIDAFIGAVILLIILRLIKRA
jgi:uncharacterized membrane protein YeaQ/YmgE (transglycosylase-associated protein family)